MLEIPSLLNQVGAVIKEAERMAHLKRENFNIFRILKVESAENNTHSAFLCELLNPHGSHGLGPTFLQLFMDTLSEKIPQHSLLKDFVVDNAIVKQEVAIGHVDLDCKTGGRMDILITDVNGRNIIIENKIYAIDQERQIERYCHYKSEKSIVFYLTLEGNEPSEGSAGDKKEGLDFFLLSYKKDILHWLTLCEQEANHFPIISETIKQYSILIKKLTNQLTSDKMNHEIHQSIKQHLKGARAVADNYASVVNEIRQNVRLAIQNELKVLGYDSFLELNKIDESNAQLVLNLLANKVFLYIESFNEKSWFSANGLCVGFLVNLEENKSQGGKVVSLFSAYGLENEGWWFGRKTLGLNLGNMDDLSMLTQNATLVETAKKVATEVKEYLDENQPVLDKLSLLFE